MNTSFKIKPITYFVVTILAYVSMTNAAAFSKLPSYLNNTTVTQEAGVNPNILLLVDDSGSMVVECTYNNKDGYKGIPYRFPAPKYTHDNITDTLKIEQSETCKNNNINHATLNVGNSRLLTAIEAMKKQIEKYQDKVNWSIRTINYGKYGQMDTEKMTPRQLAEFKDSAKRYWYSKNEWHTVPLREPLSEAGLNTDFTSNWQTVLDDLDKIKPNNDDTTPYGAIRMREDGSFWFNSAYHGGSTPSTQAYVDSISKMNDAMKYRCQKNYIVFISDGDASADPAKETYTGTYNPKSRTELSFNRMIVSTPFASRLFGSSLPFSPSTRLDPFSNQHMAGKDYGIAYFSRKLSKNDLKTSLDGTDDFGKSWDDNKDLYPKQNIETYTIGFGNSLSENGRQYLNDAATGKDLDEKNNSFYFSASNSNDLNKAFDSIFNNIAASSLINKNQSYSVATPAINEQENPSLLLSATLDTAQWVSDIKLYDVTNGKVNTKKYKNPNYHNDNRKIIVNTGNNNEWLDKANLSNQFFGLYNADSSAWKKMVNWIARKEVPTDYRHNGNMGAIIDSPIVAVKDLKDKQNKYLIAGSNDGMVYLFENNGKGYDLKLNYMPATMPKQDKTMAQYLSKQASTSYGQNVDNQPEYLLNGGILARTTSGSRFKSNANKQTFMAMNMGQGGKGMFTLHISGNDVNGKPVGLDNDNMLSSVPMFEAKESGLEYTVSTPHIGRVSLSEGISKDVFYAIFTANGYADERNDVKNTNSELHIYKALKNDVGLDSTDMQGTNSTQSKAEIIKKISVGKTGGLSEPTLIDTDLNGVIDVVYAGDYQGNMYRFDLRSKVADWKATKIFSGDQPITSAPAVLKKGKNEYVVIWGTGSDLYADDSTDKTQQTVYGVYDNIDKDVQFVTTKRDLFEQRWAESTEQYRTVMPMTKDEKERLVFVPKTDGTKHSDNKTAMVKNGWYINLKKNGERVVVRPQLELQTVILTTRSYSVNQNTNGDTQDKCIAVNTTTQTNSESWMLQLNATNGGQINTNTKDGNAYIDFANTGEKDANGRLIKAPTEIYSAYKVSNDVSSFVLSNGSRQNNLSVSVNGEESYSGESLEIGGDYKFRNNCYKKSEYKRNLFIQSGNEIQSFQFNGPICKNRLRRIAWREIFW